MDTAAQTWLGLGLAMLSALGVNWGYSKEHDAAIALPPLTPRHPLRSVRLLLGSRAWVTGFAAETVGWLIFLAALRLAPLALVQAVGAGGIAVLAFVTARGHPRRLAGHQQLAVLVALAGLGLLAASLVGTAPSSRMPQPVAAGIWVAASVGAGLLLATARSRARLVALLGLAAGLLMAAGDISAKLAVAGGWWLLAAVPLVAGYALGSLVLQSAFQHGDALTAAGISTMTTNAVPIAAGIVLFREDLPPGFQGGLQIAAFVALIASASLLADLGARHGGSSSP
ncbi:MAG: hypothetical protein QOE36_3041 [Gaiellaceae bacterium]|nr:hypothetical protein [Gaiellaceae bacterium]